MLVIGIEGSPRKKGNTEQLVSTVLEGAADAIVLGSPVYFW